MSGSVDDFEKLMLACQKVGIPLHLSIRMICQFKGISLELLAREAGYARFTLYSQLKGDIKVSPSMRGNLHKILGFDPWKYSISKGNNAKCEKNWTPKELSKLLTINSRFGLSRWLSLQMLLNLKGIKKNTLVETSGLSIQKIQNRLDKEVDLSTILRLQLKEIFGVDVWCYQSNQDIEINNQSKEKLYLAHKRMGIPTEIVIDNQLEISGLTIGGIAKKMNMSVSGVHKMLFKKYGSQKPNIKLNQYVNKKIGFQLFEEVA